MSYHGQWYGQYFGEWYGATAVVPPVTPTVPSGGSAFPRRVIDVEVRGPREYRVIVTEVLAFADETLYYYLPASAVLERVQVPEVRVRKTMRASIEEQGGFADRTRTRFVSKAQWDRDQRDLMDLMDILKMEE